MAAKLHFTENTFPLELLFERLERLVDVIVANENLHLADNSLESGRKKLKSAGGPKTVREDFGAIA